MRPDGLLRILLCREQGDFASCLEGTVWLDPEVQVEVRRAMDLDQMSDGLASRDVDVALLDLDGLGGELPEALSLAVQRAEVPVLALSSVSKPDVIRGVLRSGAQDCLTKDGKLFEVLEGAILKAIERHHVRRELRQEYVRVRRDNEVFAQVLECTMAGYWDWRIPEGVEYLSPAFKRMFGYAEHEMDNTPEAWQAIVYPEDLPRVFANYERHVATRGEFPYDQEVRYRHRDGHTVWVWCRGKVIEWGPDGEPLRMVGAHVDISELKRTQNRLLRSNAELEQYAYVVSHDLQEPVRIIANYVEILEHEWGRALSEKGLRYVGHVVSAASRMQQMIDGLLAISRVESLGKDLRLIDAKEALRDAIANLEESIHATGAEVLYSDLPWVRADRMQLAHVFQNLLSNAIKFRGTQPPRLRITTQRGDGTWIFRVADNGIGFPQQEGPRMFKIFSRLHRREDFPGSGIGLAIVQKVVARHGGRVWATSEGDEGATFSFSIPAHPADETAYADLCS